MACQCRWKYTLKHIFYKTGEFLPKPPFLRKHRVFISKLAWKCEPIKNMRRWKKEWPWLQASNWYDELKFSDWNLNWRFFSLDSFNSFEFGFGRIFLRRVPRLPSSSFIGPRDRHDFIIILNAAIRSVRSSPSESDDTSYVSNCSIHQNSIFSSISSKWPLNSIILT